MTEREGRSEAALGRPLLSVDVTMSYASLGRKTTGGWRASATEQREACSMTVLAGGTAGKEDEPEEDGREDGEVTGTWTLLWLVFRPWLGWGASPGLCLLTTGGPWLARSLCLSPGTLPSSEGLQGGGDLACSPCGGPPG